MYGDILAATGELMDAFARFAVVYAAVVIVPALAVGVASALTNRETAGALYAPVVAGLSIGVVFLEALIIFTHPVFGGTPASPAGVGIVMIGTSIVVLRFGHRVGLLGPLPWVPASATALTLGGIFWGFASLG